MYELNKFIALVNKASTIRDLSVQEPQIEEAIKVLYKKESLLGEGKGNN